ncbi:hypothetical protein B0H14DRAFT_3649277 [Mycena olivaceomarginata]|nr:hypothetical protein B0H14DRAFT_3649277 [Mycena olivaceomarginata]
MSSSVNKMEEVSSHPPPRPPPLPPLTQNPPIPIPFPLPFLGRNPPPLRNSPELGSAFRTLTTYASPSPTSPATSTSMPKLELKVESNPPGVPSKSSPSLNPLVNMLNSTPKSHARCIKDGECGKDTETDLSSGETRVELVVLDFLHRACRREYSAPLLLPDDCLLELDRNCNCNPPTSLGAKHAYASRSTVSLSSAAYRCARASPSGSCRNGASGSSPLPGKPSNSVGVPGT